MAISQPSLLLRFAHSSLQLALRFWPKESLHWGRALAAELHEIEKPFEAIRWAFGGLMLFTRASASHIHTWLRLPAGSGLPASSLLLGTNPPILPKRSRLFTAAVLLATALLVFLPQTREAISTIRASWNGFRGYSTDIRALKNLAARAEKQKDARILAFVALTIPDSSEAMTLADHAVAIDANLIWIYASRAARHGFTPPSKDKLARLLAADSDNAFPEILAAQVISEPHVRALTDHHAPSLDEIEATLSANSDWVTYMDRAFRAPGYDDYFSRHWQLTRDAWNRNPSLSPSLVFVSLWAHPLPDWFSIKSYANLLVQKAHEASRVGHSQEAESLLWEVEAFGRRVTDQSETYSEGLLGLDLSRLATSELRDFYQGLGKQVESQEAVKQLEQIDERRGSLLQSFRRIEEPRLHALERSALQVQISTILALLLAGIVALCLVTLELRPGRSSARRVRLRRMICLGADWAPATLLTACVGLLWFFQPYAQILHSARSLNSASAAWQTMHFEGLYTLASTFGGLGEPFTAVHFWQSFICGLVALALFVLVRGFLRYKRA